MIQIRQKLPKLLPTCCAVWNLHTWEQKYFLISDTFSKLQYMYSAQIFGKQRHRDMFLRELYQQIPSLLESGRDKHWSISCFSNSNKESLTMYTSTIHFAYRLWFSQKERQALNRPIATPPPQYAFQPVCRKASQPLGVMSVAVEKNKSNRCLQKWRP